MGVQCTVLVVLHPQSDSGINKICSRVPETGSATKLASKLQPLTYMSTHLVCLQTETRESTDSVPNGHE